MCGEVDCAADEEEEVSEQKAPATRNLLVFTYRYQVERCAGPDEGLRATE